MTHHVGDILEVYEIGKDYSISRVQGKVSAHFDTRLELSVPRRRRALFISLPGRPLHHFANAFVTFDEAQEEALRHIDIAIRNMKCDLSHLRAVRATLKTLKGPA